MNAKSSISHTVQKLPFLSSSHPPITLRPAREKGREEAGLFFHSFFNFTSAFLSLWCFWVFLSFLVNISSPDSGHENWSLLRSFNNLILVHWHEAKLFSNSVNIKARDWGLIYPSCRKLRLCKCIAWHVTLSPLTRQCLFPYLLSEADMSWAG